MKKQINNKLFFLLMTASFSANAIPEGWYIDSFQKHPEIVKWSRNFDESVVFRKNFEDYDSVVYWGKFDKEIDKVYDEIEVFTYFVKDFIPCFDPALIKFDEKNSRYYLRCRDNSDGNAETAEKEKFRKNLYQAVYKNIDDLGLIALGQNVSYMELAKLGFDNNPAIQTKDNPEKSTDQTVIPKSAYVPDNTSGKADEKNKNGSRTEEKKKDSKSGKAE